MADAKKCDRCGEFYVPALNVKKKFYVAKKKWSAWDELDLCSNCQNKLQEFLGLDRENEEESNEP